jgi:hypothetical protein
MRARLLAISAALTLGACAPGIRLLEDGKAHGGVVDFIASTMTVSIDGDTYTGPITRGVSTGFMTGFAGTRAYSGTMIGISDQFQALLTNSAGKILRCQFQSAGGRGQGICQNNDGRTFDFVQGGGGGQPVPTTQVPAASTPTAPSR